MELNGANDLVPPQCQAIMRLHKMLLDGTIGEHAEFALQSDRRLKDQHQRLRSCDDSFGALLASYSAAARQDTENPALKSPLTPYTEYLDCIGNALCPKALVEWKTCMASVMTGEKYMQECALTKRLLERCLRSKSEELLQGSQPQVFRPNATP